MYLFRHKFYFEGDGSHVGLTNKRKDQDNQFFVTFLFEYVLGLFLGKLKDILY